MFAAIADRICLPAADSADTVCAVSWIDSTVKRVWCLGLLGWVGWVGWRLMMMCWRGRVCVAALLLGVEGGREVESAGSP